MKKWSEIRQGIINKLFMDEEEVNSETENYASKFAFYANECLNQIANGVKPRIAVFDFTVYLNSIIGSNFEIKRPKIEYEIHQITPGGGSQIIKDSFEVSLGVTQIFRDSDGLTWETDGYTLKQTTKPAGMNFILGNNPKLIPLRIEYDSDKWVVPDTKTIYYDGQYKYMYQNNELIKKENVFMMNETIKMPDDFLSFADLINYKDGVADPTIVYVSDKHINVDGAGSYKIFYNALWEPITEDYMNDQEQPDLPIDQSVLNCIPAYVASQILAEDDVQRSAMLRNEYELMLSRLDTNIMYQENHFKSTGGWY